MGSSYNFAALLVIVNCYFSITLSETLQSRKQYTLEVASELPPSCDSGWVKVKHEKCIKFFPEALNQTEAQKSCRSLNSDLASVQNSYEDIDFLVGYMRKETLISTVPEAAWLGGMRVKSRWFWLDLSWFKTDRYYFPENMDLGSIPHPGVKTFDTQEYRSWPVACLTLKSEPEVQERRGPSGIVYKGDFLGYQLNPSKCEEMHSYFCQKLLEIPVTRVLWEDSQASLIKNTNQY